MNFWLWVLDFISFKIQIELLTTGLVLTGHALGIRINKFVIGDRSQNYVYKRRGVGGQKN